MVKDKKIEPQERSSVKLTVTVDREAARNEYENLVQGYAKEAQIKGFRKGHVPVTVLERKFGESLKAEATQKILEESMKEVLDTVDKQPLPYSVPRMDEDVELDFENDFTFTVKYDVYPDITLGTYKGIEIEAPQVTIGKEDEERELKALQEQNSVVTEKDEGKVEKDNIVTVDYAELDENGEEIANSKREDFVFTVGTGYNIYKMDDDVTGMEKGETKIIEKSFPDDFETESLRGTSKKIRVTVKTIKQQQLPEIDDELAQDISDKYETLDDLKKDIRKRLEDTAQSRIRQTKADALMDKIVEASTIDLPESMVQAELDSSWRNFVNQFRAQEEAVLAMLEAQGRTRQQLLDEWRPSAETSLRKQLLIHKMVEEEKIEATDEEADAEIKRQAESGSMTFEDLKEYYQQRGMMEMVKHDIAEKKLFDKLFEENTVKKGKKVKFLDLMQRNQ